MQLPTTEVHVVPAGESPGLDAHRRPLPAQPGEPRGPYPAQISEVAADQLLPDEREGQLRVVTCSVDPAAWPIGVDDQLRDPRGQLYDVTGAVLRDTMPGLEHVAVRARRVEPAKVAV